MTQTTAFGELERWWCAVPQLRRAKVLYLFSLFMNFGVSLVITLHERGAISTELTRSVLKFCLQVVTFSSLLRTELEAEYNGCRVLVVKASEQFATIPNGTAGLNGHHAQSVNGHLLLAHQQNLAWLKANYSPRGQDGKPAYSTFYSGVKTKDGAAISPAEFSAWLNEDRHIGREKRKLLTAKADRLRNAKL